MKIATLALAGLASLSPLAALEMQPEETAAPQVESKKRTNVDWYRLVRVTYKSGKTKDALNIIREHFHPCTLEAGTPVPQLLVHETGDYHVTVIWPLTEGTSSLDWEISPDSAKWREALIRREGGEEKAMALMEEYGSYVQSYSADLVRGFADIKPKAMEASAK